ncbi:MAG: ABC transporter permease [Acidimicrobiales bacterium]
MTTVAIRPTRNLSWLPVAVALAKRSLVGITRLPSAVIPLIAMPVFFVIAFSGSFTSLTKLPNFPTENILDWMVPFAIVQGSAFAGFGTGFSMVRDIETGFYDRLLLAPGSRLALLVAPILAGIVRCTVTLTIVLGFGLALGTDLPGGLPGVATLWVAAVGVATIATGWALGLVYRVPDQRAGPMLQLGIFMSMFLSTGNVPLFLQTGWVKEIARYNPLTDILALARQGFLGDITWSSTWPGLVAIGGSMTALWLFAARGLSRFVN